MTVTYATSTEHGRNANMKVVSSSSRPTEAQIDVWRRRAYIKIGKIVGHGATDSNDVLWGAELSLVEPLIRNAQKDEPTPDLVMVMTDEIYEMLMDEFPSTADIGWATFIPGENTGG